MFVRSAIIVFAGLIAHSAHAREEILRYHSAIDVQPDASIIVTEHINVTVEGVDIKRGIYRDFPMRPEILEVMRAGLPEAYHTESQFPRGLRLYCGKRQVLLPFGEHRYTIRYRVPNQVRFFDEHDEVYWQVTGTQWSFPIREASARVKLPVEADRIAAEAYTGSSDESGREYEVTEITASSASVRATRSLSPGEGFTVVVTFPKGIAEEPSASEKVVATLGVDRTSVTAFGGLLVVVVYYGLVWVLVGRDPAKGRLRIRESPPEGISPAAARYVKNMGHDQKCLNAAVVSLAVKGYLLIEKDSGGDYTLERTGSEPDDLSEDERALGRALFEGGDRVQLSRTNQKRLAKALSEHRSALSAGYKSSHFRRNFGYVAVGVIASAVIIVLSIFQYGDSATQEGISVLVVFLAAWTIGLYAAADAAVTGWLKTFRGDGNWLYAIVFTGVTIIFAAGEIGGIFFLTRMGSFLLGIAVVLHVVAAAFATWLMKAYTPQGRELLTAVEGFGLWLKGETHSRFAPGAYEQNTAVFERFLPYALALGYQDYWSEEFEQSLKATGEPYRYQPVWYPIPYGRGLAPSDLGSSVFSDMGSAFSSASTPASSGSGGGGSVGGGGGGGGGGGW